MKGFEDLSPSDLKLVEQEAFRFIILAGIKVNQDLIVSLCQGINPLPDKENTKAEIEARFEVALQELLAGGADTHLRTASYISAYIARMKNGENP